MDPTTVLAALVAGATVALRDTASQAVKDAYAGLKTLLIDRFGVASVHTLEKSPSDESFKSATLKEIGLTPDLTRNQEVLKAIDAVYASLEEHEDPDELRSIGVDVKSIKSERSTIIREIQGFDTGIKSEAITSGHDTLIEGVSGKPRA